VPHSRACENQPKIDFSKLLSYDAPATAQESTHRISASYRKSWHFNTEHLHTSSTSQQTTPWMRQTNAQTSNTTHKTQNTDDKMHIAKNTNSTQRHNSGKNHSQNNSLNTQTPTNHGKGQKHDKTGAARPSSSGRFLDGRSGRAVLGQSRDFPHSSMTLPHNTSSHTLRHDTRAKRADFRTAWPYFRISCAGNRWWTIQTVIF
jgi:hypothetical protein